MQKYIGYCLVPAVTLSLQAWGSAALSAPLDVQTKAPHNLQTLSFLQGTWHANSPNGSYAEEYWSAPVGDGMIGHCRFIKKGKTTFYELLAIFETQSGLVLRMKHFSGSWVGWDNSQEAGDCKLIHCSADEAVFANATPAHAVRVSYRKTGPESLHVLVEDTKHGKKSSYPFDYQLAK
jgi:Domain of unknown function (DUF6265)